MCFARERDSAFPNYGSDVDGTNGREYAGLNQEGDANEGTSSRHAVIRVSTPPLEKREINGGGTTAEGPGKGKQKIPGGTTSNRSRRY